MDPCKTCGDRACCRMMCRQKKDYLDFVEGEKKQYVVKNTRRIIVSMNKNGIRKEEYR